MLFYSSQTIGSQHLLKPSFLNTDFEKNKTFFSLRTLYNSRFLS